jgi:hypothetical protein
MARVLYPRLFPFCVENAEQAASWDEPLSLETAMALYWKVKSWSVQITGDLFYEIFRYVPSGVTNTLQWGAQTLDGKICYDFRSSNPQAGVVSDFDVTLYVDYPPEEIQVEGQAGLNIFYFDSLYSGGVKKVDNRYYAGITVGGNYGGNQFSNRFDNVVVGNYRVSYYDKVHTGELRALDSYVQGGNIQLNISASSYFNY